MSILMQSVLGWLVARTYLVNHNTLQANGRWRSTKTELSRGVLGAYAYTTELQSLAHGRLHLSSWHGFNEVIYASELRGPARLEFEFGLNRGAYLVAILGRDSIGRSAGLRLSRAAAYPSSFVEFDAAGQFLRKQVLVASRFDSATLHAVAIELAPDRLVVRIDGVEAGEFPYSAPESYLFGFRGGLHDAFIDEVRVTLASGEVVSEDFDSPAAAGWVSSGVVLALFAANFVILVLARRGQGADVKIFGFRYFTVSLTLLVISALLYFVVAARTTWYPSPEGKLAAAEAYFNKGAQERVLEEIRQRFDGRPLGATRRILFVGSSQTWGAGALRDEDGFVPLLERILAKRFPGGTAIECINGGISSTRAADLESLVATEWMKYEPELVVINLSSNDRSTKGMFAPAIRRMIEAARAAGATPVLVQEANQHQAVMPNLRTRHGELAEIGAELGVRVLDMQSYLETREDDGFLWWDKVHLTSYGQALVAERLADQLEDLIHAN